MTQSTQVFTVKMSLPSSGKFDPPLFWERKVTAQSRREAEQLALLSEPKGTRIRGAKVVRDGTE